MLTVTIPASEQYNELTNEFVVSKRQVLQLEHSLVSVSKWESHFCKPFLTKTPKTNTESIYYVRCMTLTQYVDPVVYYAIPSEVMNEIAAYIDAPMTATTFLKDETRSPNREIITSEIIYYWMIALNIPFECQKWHLNRLLTLINVCNIKSQPPKKMSRKELADRNRVLNEARKSRLNTSG